MMASFIRSVNLCCTLKLRADGRGPLGFQMKLALEIVYTDFSCGDDSLRRQLSSCQKRTWRDVIPGVSKCCNLQELKSIWEAPRNHP